MFKTKIKFQKINKNAIVPKRAHKSDAGLDLHAIEKTTVKAQEFKIVKTGLKMSMPNNYEAQIRPRSGLAAKKGISVLNTPGTIDAGYRGEIGVILVNHSKEDFEINPGDRIAQMVISKLSSFKITTVSSLNDSDRNDGGFGSTGVKK
ncbi:MAG: dUTP diphosphatase [Candidatus Woesearchaeota archaeon]